MSGISWFISHPIQYFSPLLKALGKKTNLSVYYYSDSSIKGHVDKGFGIPVQWDTDLLDGYFYRFIKNLSRRKVLNNGFWDAFNPGVIKTIRKSKGTIVIVNGWSYSSDLMVILFSRLAGRKLWLRAENPLNQELRKSRTVLFLKKILLKKILFRIFVDKCLFIGKENKRFFEFYGVSPAKLIYTPYSVDNHFFSSKADELKGKTVEVKKRLGLPCDRKIILFTGKYIPKKNPMDLLKAFQLLGNEHYALVMVGEGELRTGMEQFIRTSGLQHVYLTGFVNQSEVPDYYAVADVFVMCSGMGETWGLAVNEAMNFRKPVIVSDTCGCSSDLVIPGENGFIFPEGDIQALAGCIGKLFENEALCLSAGNRSGEIIRQYSIDRIVDNMSSRLAGV